MCVIVFGKDVKPKDGVLEACEDANGDGNGVAWTDGRRVFWEKGIKLDVLEKRVAEAPSWWVAHFRISTAGGKPPQLCHPFPLTPDSSIELSGETREVLFHNGHHSRWQEQIVETFVAKSRGRVKLPPGPWSDSRALAWLCSFGGRGMLRFAQGKFALLSPRGIRTFPDHTVSSDWTQRDGLWFSNMNWVGRYKSTKVYSGPSNARMEAMYGWCHEGECSDGEASGSGLPKTLDLSAMGGD